MIAREEAHLISMREDGFYKAVKGITSLDEITRTVFCLEADEGFRRTAKEVIALCEGRGKLPAGGLEQGVSRGLNGTALERDGKSKDGQQGRVAEGEAYRICFDTATIGADIDQIAGFFKAYQRISQEMGASVDSRLMGRFVDFIVHTVKRVELSMKADFVEFSLWVEDGKVSLVLETLAPKTPSFGPLHSSRENGMRLLNYLLPPSGYEETVSAERHLYRKEPSQLKRASLFDVLRNGEEDSHVFGEEEAQRAMVPYAGGGSVQYVKHRETLDWTGFSDTRPTFQR
jgi:type IV pilus assembly protein PilB